MLQDYETKNPELVIASIRYLVEKIEWVMWNICQDDYDAPIYNNGSQFCIPEFKLRAYDWGFEQDESNPTLPEPNFEWRDYKLWWYKHLGRGMYSNREISCDELQEMLRECQTAVEKLEKVLEPHKGFFRSEKWKLEAFEDKERGIHIS